MTALWITLGALGWLVAIGAMLALFAGAKRRDAAQERALREVRR